MCIYIKIFLKVLLYGPSIMGLILRHLNNIFLKEPIICLQYRPLNILIYFLLKNMDKRNLNRYNIINNLKNIYGTDFL